MVHTYQDLNLNYQVTPGDAVVYDVDAILVSINNILGTPYYSRLFNRGFGSKLLSVLFQPVNVDTASSLLDNIVDALSAEPRIYVDRNSSYVIPFPENNAYKAQISFIIKYNGQVGQYNQTFKAMS